MSFTQLGATAEVRLRVRIPLGTPLGAYAPASSGRLSFLYFGLRTARAWSATASYRKERLLLGTLFRLTFRTTEGPPLTATAP
jgi:hypothetical protein